MIWQKAVVDSLNSHPVIHLEGLSKAKKTSWEPLSLRLCNRGHTPPKTNQEL